ncbi:zinc transporter ZIP1-like [Stegodyphus dumicola]|uniref:zinc transporter ZIP1-like n=1 Tax=Stegodyphus dumicola TaxID=202533 RepID=UPI0015B1CC5F|nr:zinc transporter ZIP1-like [Stegodyphus dumicola]
MELRYIKLLSAFCLLIVTFASSMVPLYLIKKYRSDQNRENRSQNFRVISFLSCFGGGVFLGTCLLHLFPDVREQIDLVFKTMKFSPNYPVAEFLFGFGFLTVLIVEQIVLNCQDDFDEEKVPFLVHEHSHQNLDGEVYTTINNYGAVNDERTEHHDHEISFHQDQSSHSVLRSLFLVFALSLHSVFEGLAIGLQASAESVIRILLAVLIHKCILAFTLSLNLSHSKLKKGSIVKGNIIFSLTSPVGIVIGVVLIDFVKGLSMLVTSGVLQGLAAGTFI